MLKNYFGFFLEAKTWQIFLLYVMGFYLLTFLNQEFLYTDELFEEYITSQRVEKYGNYDELADEFEDDLDDYIENEWSIRDDLFDLFIFAVISVVKFIIVSAFVFVSLSFSGIERIKYSLIFKASIVAKLIFIVPAIVKVIWFYFIDSEYDYIEFKNFNPFSLLSLVDQQNAADWITLPLASFDVFEAGYLYILVIGVSNLQQLPTNQTVKPILMAYLTMTILSISLRLYISSLI